MRVGKYLQGSSCEGASPSKTIQLSSSSSSVYHPLHPVPRSPVTSAHSETGDLLMDCVLLVHLRGAGRHLAPAEGRSGVYVLSPGSLHQGYSPDRRVSWTTGQQRLCQHCQEPACIGDALSEHHVLLIWHKLLSDTPCYRALKVRTV